MPSRLWAERLRAAAARGEIFFAPREPTGAPADRHSQRVESNPITLCCAAFPHAPAVLQAPRGNRSGAELADNGCCSLLFTCNRSMRGWCAVTVLTRKASASSSSFRRKANTMRLTIVSPPFCGTVSKSDQIRPSSSFFAQRYANICELEAWATWTKPFSVKDTGDDCFGRGTNPEKRRNFELMRSCGAAVTKTSDRRYNFPWSSPTLARTLRHLTPADQRVAGRLSTCFAKGFFACCSGSHLLQLGATFLPPPRGMAESRGFR